jgi:hypothetical protein
MMQIDAPITQSGVTPPKYEPPQPKGIVHYFPHGKLNGDPLPAVVLKDTKRGTIDLAVLSQSGRWSKRVGVWYAHDPSLQTRDRTIISSRGLWDYVPGLPPVDDRERADGERDLSFRDTYRRLVARVEALEKLVSQLTRRDGVAAKQHEPPEKPEDEQAKQSMEARTLELLAQGLKISEVARRLSVQPSFVSAVARRRKTSRGSE